MSLSIASEKFGEVLIFSPQGQLNSVNAAAAETELVGHVSPSAKIALNFANLDYISSAGLRVVLVLAKRLKQVEGQLVLFGLQPHVHEVFEISGFLGILEVFDTREQALARLA